MQEIALFLLLAFSSFYSGNCVSHSSSTPALYVFGDSLVDTGNNNWLLTIAKANYLPYGRDFGNGLNPTGRVTNGENVPDFIAKTLGLPYPKRIKDPWLPLKSFTGYNYASAGCGILPQTGPANCLNLTKQVSLFENTIETVLRPEYDQAQLEYHLANSIYFVWVGNNDYLLNYFNVSSGSSDEYTPEEFADLLVAGLSEKLQLLHRLGARKIVLFEVAPLGCIPFYVKNIEEGCVEIKNEIAQIFNAKLIAKIQELRISLQNPYFTIGKSYDISYDAISNPSKYGLTNVRNACCILLQQDGKDSVPCKHTLLGGGSCHNRDEYLFWDAAHPTQAAYSVLAHQCITNSTVCSPLNIHDLSRVVIEPSASASLVSAA